METKSSKFSEKQYSVRSVSSLEELYNEHYDFLLRYGLSATNNIDLVKDSIQDMFVKLYDNISLLEGIDNVRAYLVRSLRNRMIDQLKNFYNRKSCAIEETLFSVSEDLFGDVSDQDDETIASDARLRKSINSLTVKQREVLYLRYVEKLSYREISQLLSIEEQSAKNSKTRALQKLRNIMKVMIVLYFR